MDEGSESKKKYNSCLMASNCRPARKIFKHN